MITLLCVSKVRPWMWYKLFVLIRNKSFLLIKKNRNKNWFLIVHWQHRNIICFCLLMTLYLSILLYSCVSSINILVDYLGFLWRHNVSWDNNCLRTGTVSFLPFQSACLLLLLLLLFLFFFSSFSSSFFFTLLLWLELPVQCWLCKSGVISFLNIGHKFLVNLLILEGLFYFILFFWQPFFFFLILTQRHAYRP